MEIIIIILLLALLVGLLARDKGDSLLDTIGAGCSGMITLVVVVVFLLMIMLYTC